MSVSARRARAIRAVRAAVEALRCAGVEAKVGGSLAKETFGPHSDVDLLITACPRHLKYAIEGLIEDQLDGLPFDCVYLDEVPAHKLAGFADGAVDASSLR